MLGRALSCAARNRNYEVIGAARSNADVELNLMNTGDIYTKIKEIRPDVIINTAALTDLSKCEGDPGTAYCINARPAGVIAKCAKEIGSYFIHISTDHYYTGDRDKRHNENDRITLVNEYARTKYLGECLALAEGGALVVRTNIVGFRGTAQPTFVEWVLKVLHEKQPFTMFNDFYTSSIHVVQLANALFDLMQRNRIYGTLNVGSREVCNKQDFISKLARRLNLSLDHARAGSVKNLTNPVRAESIGLDVSLAEKYLGYLLPTADEVIESVVKEYKGMVP